MRKFFLLILMVIFERVSAREYPMLHYSIEDGLASNTIYDIYQDPDGILWIGTDKGVSCFNGIDFVNFTTYDGLADNECFYFRRDMEGRLWIACYNGELCFYKNGKFYNAKNTPWMKLPKSNFFREIKILNDSGIAFYSAKNAEVFVLHKDKFTRIHNQYTNEKVQDLKDFKLIDTNKYELYYEDEILTIVSNKLTSKRILNPFIKTALPVQGTSYYINTNGRVLDSEMKELSLLAKDDGKNLTINRIRKTNGHELLATDKGLYIDNLKAILSQQNIHTVTIDAHGDYWIGTKQNGLYCLSKDFNSQKQINNAYNIPIVFADSKNGHFVFATDNGNLTKIDDNDSAVCIFNYDYYQKSPAYYSKNYTIDSKKIIYGIDAANYRMFLHKLVLDDGFDKLLPLIGNATVQKKISKNFASHITNFLQNDSLLYFKGRYVISCINKNHFLKPKKNYRYTDIFINNGKDAIFGFSKGLNNDIWISTLKSVYRITGYIPNKQKQFGSLSFRSFIFLKKQIIGISHSNDLLLCSNIESANVKVDTIKGKDYIWDKIFLINDSTALVSSNSYPQIIKLRPSSVKVAYSTGVLENPFIPYQPEFIYIDSTSAYFFKKGAISCFPKNYLLQDFTLPKVKFTSIITNKANHFIKDSFTTDYNSSKNIKLRLKPYSVYYKNLTYEYAISLPKQKDQWISSVGEEINLVNIGYGKFTIKVRAKTLSGYYSKPASFVLIVQKPYWATWWFIATVSLLLIAIIAIFARLGVKSRLKKKEGEVRFLRSEYKALNALMNPHFIFNSLNSVQSLINNNENSIASKYVRIFSDLIRQNMRNISNELIPLSKELDLVENYLKIEKLRFKEKLNYSINIDEEVEIEMILIPPLLIQPLVENAIKHGIWPKKTNDGLIQIRISEQDNLLKIEIEDNGSGFLISSKTDTLHESYAMGNIHQRIEQLSQIHDAKFTIKIEEIKEIDGEVRGALSTVTIQLPKA
ncbi:MAG: histidine kinase [Bacteroidota bacterium]